MQTIRVYDAEGHDVWSWSTDASVRALWPCGDASHAAVAALVGERTIIKAVIGERRIQKHTTRGAILAVSPQRDSADDWIVMATDDGRVEWMALSRFAVVEEGSAIVDFPIGSIIAIPAPGQGRSQTRAAIGLTKAGQFFAVQERRARLYPECPDINRLLMTTSGRFVLFVLPDRIEAYRNPALAVANWQVDVSVISGALAVGAFTKFRLKIVNTGVIPIHHLEATLYSDGIIDRVANGRASSLPVLPGGAAELEFGVRAQVSGDGVPLTLQLILGDESGPPYSAVEHSLSVESR